MDLTRLAREHGDKPAVVMAGSGATLSYAELDRQSNKIAQLFRSLGLRPGDHIAVLTENRPEFFPVVWAAQRSGLFYTPMDCKHSSAICAVVRCFVLACGSVISLVLVIYGVFAMSCALDVPLIGVMLGREHRWPARCSRSCQAAKASSRQPQVMARCLGAIRP